MKKIIVILLSTLLFVPFLGNNNANAQENKSIPQTITNPSQPFYLHLENGKVIIFESKQAYEEDLKNNVDFLKLSEEIENCFLNNSQTRGNIMMRSASNVSDLKKKCDSYTTDTKNVRIRDVIGHAYTSKHVIQRSKTFTGTTTVGYEGTSFSISSSYTVGGTQDFTASKTRKSTVSLYQKVVFYKFKCGKYNILSHQKSGKPYLKLRYV